MPSKFLIIMVVSLIKAVEPRGKINIGRAFGADLVYHEVHEKYGIPLLKREEDVFVSGVGNEQIQAVIVHDLRGDGVSHVVDGGVGRQNVTIRLESEIRGNGYKFLVDVFAV